MEVHPLGVEQAVTLAFEPETFTARFGLPLVPGWAVPEALGPTALSLIHI